ncbi:AfsR/SARP family transcriptional regulator [Nonomuraea longicatena]|uniref:OmpR/PhoB-type domain-containing protein n=1 Tax=Nonomuraea longicatena TaxID=83682 RepID=A0ABP4A0A6_9ACTN
MPEFKVLGPLEVRDPGGRVLVPSRRKARLLLAILLLRAGSPITTDQLLETLWEDAQPSSARANLQSYISHLRRFAGAPILTYGDGYLLDPDGLDYDAAAFERMAALGRRALAEGRLGEADRQLTAAMALWRGDLLDGLVLPEWLQPDRIRLEELRLAAFEDATAAALALGRHNELIPALREFTGRHPLRERGWAHLVHACHLAGRTAEALDTYQSVARVLDRELGVSPGQELRDLHEKILRENAEAAEPPPAMPVPRQLPAPLPDFVGRRALLAALERPWPSPWYALTGMGGVGKTALAVRWAARAAARFPDGQLHLDLRGYTPCSTPMSPYEALTRFLRAFGMPYEQIPGSVDEAAVLYRSCWRGAGCWSCSTTPRTTSRCCRCCRRTRARR